MKDEEIGAYLKVIDGSMKGQQRKLFFGRPLTVGRLAECDLSIHDDQRISRQHCEISVDTSVTPPVCRLKNLSSNGTRVNGRRIDSEALLTHGDQIAIGERTVMFLSLQQLIDSVFDSATYGSGVQMPIPLSIHIKRTPRHSGLLHLDSASSAIAREPMAAKLEELSPQFAIINFTKAGLPIPEEITDPQHLLDWHPSKAMAEASPIVVSKAEVANLPELINQVWGREATILVYSELGPVELLEHLRNLTQYDPVKRAFNRGGGLFAYYEPAICAQLLDVSPPDMVEHMLDGIAAVMLDIGGSDQTWKAFSRDAFLDRLFHLESSDASSR